MLHVPYIWLAFKYKLVFHIVYKFAHIKIITAYKIHYYTLYTLSVLSLIEILQLH